MVKYRVTGKLILDFNTAAKQAVSEGEQWFTWGEQYVPLQPRSTKEKPLAGFANEIMHLLDYDRMYYLFQDAKIEYWADAGRGESSYYIYDDHEIWISRDLFSGEQKYLCTTLVRAEFGTCLCECKTCGKRYVVSAKQAAWFKSKNLIPPTGACHECRHEAKEGA